MEIKELQISDIDFSKEPLISSVKMSIDNEWKRIRISWSCIIDSELNLIIVVRTPVNINNLDEIVLKTEQTKDIQVFIYSRKYTECHLEYLDEDRYNYFVFPGKLSGSTIYVFMQRKNNYVLHTDISAKVMDASVTECILHYRLGLGFGKGRLFKRAYINVKRSYQGNDDVIEYKIQEHGEVFKINLTEARNSLVVPLRYREKIHFLNPRLRCIQKNMISWLIWKYIKHERGI